MNDNSKLVLCTGAPGSVWSMISNKIKKNFVNFDKSDETKERKYHIPEQHKSEFNIKDPSWIATTHVGCYFGPYHEFGHHFDDIKNHYTQEEFFKECMIPYSHDDKPYKLIRSHWFSYNLDWIWDNCKGHRLFLVWRDAEHAKKWWYNMGGWNINHPIYKWYDNDDRMWEKIQEETNNILEFANRKNIQLINYSEESLLEYWKQHWEEEPSYVNGKANPVFSDEIKFAIVDIT